MTDPHYSSSSDEEELFEDASPVSTIAPNMSDEMKGLVSQQQNITLDDEKNDLKDQFDDCHDEEPTIKNDEESQRDYEKTLSPEQLAANKERADALKLEGNRQFKCEAYAEAFETYTNAIELCPLSYPNERAILFGNRGAALIQLDSKQAAIADCSKSLELNTNYMKVLTRRAKLYEESDKLDDSMADYKRIVEMDPANGEAHGAIVRLTEKINERNEKLKTEMMGKLKDLGNMILKPFGLSTNNFQMQQDPSTGSYSVNFKQNQ